MLADTLNSVMTKLPHHWKVKVTPSGRILFQLAPLVRRTKETDSGLWPTPTAMTGGTGVAPSHKNGKHGWNIGAAVNDSLSDSPVKLWPTPTRRDYKGGYSGGRIRNGKVSMDTLDVAVQYTDNQSRTSGQLNPTWVEWLMGYPTGHTELSASETQSFLKSRKSSDKQ